MSKQTLEQAVFLAKTGKSKDLAYAAGVLNGLPQGAWAQTEQARSELVAALPVRSARDYNANEFIQAMYHLEPQDNAASVYRAID